MHPFLDHPRPLAFAHRGGAQEAPENTMRAFEAAVRLGYRYVETDLRLSADGVPMVFHDATLERVTDGVGLVAERTRRELQGVRVAGGEPIPTLEELLGTWPDLRVNIDPKCDAVLTVLAATLRRTRALDRVCVASFSERRIRRARRLIGPGLCTSLGPLGVARLRLLGGAAGRGSGAAPCAQVPPRWRGIPLVDARLLRAARRADLQVHVWTVDRQREMHRLLELGVDGLMSDRPTLLRAVCLERGLWTGGA